MSLPGEGREGDKRGTGGETKTKEAQMKRPTWLLIFGYISVLLIVAIVVAFFATPID